MSTAARLATRLDSEADGGENKEALEAVELVDLGEMLCELSVVVTAGSGIMGASLTGLKSLDLAVCSKLSPTEMQRVGRIAHRMAGEGYEPPAINLVVRVLLATPPAAP